MNVFTGNRTSFLRPLFEAGEEIGIVLAERGTNLEKYAKSKNLKILYYSSEKSLVNTLEKIDFTYLYSAGCKYVLPEDLIMHDDRFFLNMHPSLLPKYPGIHAITEALYNQGPFGVTIHTMQRQVDAGLLISQKELSFSTEQSALDIYQKFFFEEERLVKESLANGLFQKTYLQNQYLKKISPEYSGFKRDLNFRRISTHMTRKEIIKLIKILNIENQYAFIDVKKTRYFIHDSSFESGHIHFKGHSKCHSYLAQDGLMYLCSKSSEPLIS
jgi:methionyl-tRNA formyltransferase